MPEKHHLIGVAFPNLPSPDIPHRVVVHNVDELPEEYSSFLKDTTHVALITGVPGVQFSGRCYAEVKEIAEAWLKYNQAPPGEEYRKAYQEFKDVSTKWEDHYNG